MASSLNTIINDEMLDSDWIRQSFFVPIRGDRNRPNAREKDMRQAGAFSYQTLSFRDTTPGGNGSFGTKPQFTCTADIRLPSLLSHGDGRTDIEKNKTLGMGRAYAEAIDANADRIYMQFGIPAFNSVTNYLTSFYDPDMGNMVNSGRVASDLFYTAGKYAGFIFFWYTVPEFCIANLIYSTSRKFINDTLGQPMYKFYYCKPTMALYWSTVTTMLNAITVNMGLGQGVSAEDRVPGTRKQQASEYGKNGSDIAKLAKILPDILLDSNGGIDPRRVSGRYQRMADAHLRIMDDIKRKSKTYEEYESAISKYLNGSAQRELVRQRAEDTEKFAEYIDGYMKSAAGIGTHLIDALMDVVLPEGDKAPDTVAADAKNANASATEASTFGQTVSNFWTGLTQHLTEYSDFALAEMRSGTALVSFIVDHEPTVSESFSNSTRSSDLGNKINSTSKEARAKWYDMANGNIGDGFVSQTIETIASSVSSFVAGGLDFIGFGGLSALGGKAFADIPEFWESSSTRFPSASYTMQLRTPYGNPISILLKIILPMVMLIAGVAPRSTGRSSYSGPFLCKLWNKGKTQISLGLIESLEIRRGVGNVGWNVNRQCTAVDISFTVKNLSSLTHVPITNELKWSELTPGSTMFDEDTNFTDYMAVLGSLGVSEQFYASDRWRLREARRSRNFDTFISPENFLQSNINDTIPGSLMSIIARKGVIG